MSVKGNKSEDGWVYTTKYRRNKDNRFQLYMYKKWIDIDTSTKK
jgi:hypothetical protein